MKLSIDKVSLRYPYIGGPDVGEEYHQMLGFKKSLVDGTLGKQGTYWSPKKGQLTYMNLQLDGGATLTLAYGFCGKKHWGWVEFNPNRLEADDYVELSGYLTQLFTNGAQTLLSKAGVARLDIALDVHHSELHDLIFVDDRARIDTVYPTGGTTIYLGRYKGPRNFAIYDKAKERKDKAGEAYENPWVRIEARLRDPKSYAFANVLSIPNPFQRLSILDRHKL